VELSLVVGVTQEASEPWLSGNNLALAALGLLIAVGTGYFVHSRDRKGVMRRLRESIKINQPRLEQGNLSALNTDDWEACESEVSELMPDEAYTLLNSYFTTLDEMKATATVDESQVAATLNLGNQAQDITNKYSSGWRRWFGPLPRIFR
jgi:hypothetical protein